MFSKLKQLLKKTQGSNPPSSESKKKSTPSGPGHHSDKPSQADDKPRPAKTPGKSVKALKGRTKQGLPVFHPDQDFGELFGADEVDLPSPHTAKPTSDRHTKTNTPKKKPPRLNKHGFPIMDSRDDLEAAFLENDTKDTGPEETSTSSPEGPEAKEPPLMTKHGIRILKDGDVPFEKGETAEEPKFEDLLYESLGDKTMDVLLHEKKDVEKKRKKPSLKQLLDRYPAPQGQLDLHGYTALKAELRVESYLKNAFYNQTYTVNIIVGKGLHSEEGAVLPDVVETKLIQLKKEGMVLSYAWDKKRKSRSGAVIVYLDNRLRE